jgi:hypothetical protein
MRRSTLWMCALLVTTTFGCERIKPRVAPIGAAFSKTTASVMAAIKDKVELVRVRFLHKKPALAPTPVAATPAEPAAAAPAPTPARHAPAHPAPTEPVPQIPVSGPARVRDVPYVSQDTGTIFPGMAERDVYSLWGAPAAVRHLGEFTYLFFQNGCEYSCGTMDVVTLQNGRVTDAIVRWPGHGYGGQSTSPTREALPTGPPDGGDNLRIRPDTSPTTPTTP